MAGLLRVDARVCDLGAAVGHELAGNHSALVLSDESLHGPCGVAIVVPLTTARPVPPHRWHVSVGNGSAWASVRQPRTIALSRLKRFRFLATSNEMDEVAQAVSRWMGEPRHSVESGDVIRGDLYRVNLPGLSSGAYSGMVLVVDFSPGNGMVVALVVNDSDAGGGAFRVGFRLEDGVARSALVHQVRSLSVCRLGPYLGRVEPEVLNAALTGFARWVL